MTPSERKTKKPSLFVRIRKYVYSAIEKRQGAFMTTHFRPMRASEFGRSSLPTPKLPPYAVILRGLLVTEEDFTLETVKMYAKLFPGAPLIVSTWKDSPAELVSALETIPNVHIVLNDKPPFQGYGHSNYQIACAAAGLKKAEELGASHAFITRVDQRMYATDVYPYLYGLTDAFPVLGGTPQKKRVVALGYSTLKYRRYSMNDMFFFGTCSDLKLYWDIPYDTRDISKLYTIGEWSLAKVCEGYFFTSFLKGVGHEIKDTHADYWEALGKYFILVDASSLDWYWIKYARYQEYRDKQYKGVTVGEEISFKEWIILSRPDYKAPKIPEGLDSLANDTHSTRIDTKVAE